VREFVSKPTPLPSGNLLSGATDPREVIHAAPAPEYRLLGTKLRREAEKNLAREGRYVVFAEINEVTELVPPIDWLQDPFASRSWRAQLHTLRLLDVLFQIYL
jgi:hypothetical protein